MSQKMMQLGNKCIITVFTVLFCSKRWADCFWWNLSQQQPGAGRLKLG